MFVKACAKIRETIYGVLAKSNVGSNQLKCSTGTGFMIAPGIVVTTAHLTHIENDITRPRHAIFQVIRAPEITQPMERAQFIVEDTTKDIALLQINNPRSRNCVVLEKKEVPVGIKRGSLGFPLSSVTVVGGRPRFNLRQRFQGGSVSAFVRQTDSSGNEISYYEADTLMYKGSSGCPCFLVNGNVFGMQIRTAVERSVDQQGESNTSTPNEHFLSISILATSMDIIDFARNNSILLPRRRLLPWSG